MMQTESPEILTLRLKTSLSVRELLSSDVLGELPRTIDEDRSSGEECLEEMPVRILSFSGSLQKIPVLKLSAVLGIAGIVVLAHQMGLSLRSLPASLQTSFHAAAPEEPVAMTDSGSVTAEESGALLSRTESASGQSVVDDVVSSPSVRADNKIGIFLTAASVASHDFFLRTIDDLASASGTALVFDVKGGTVLFHAAAPMANRIGLVTSIYELPQILTLLRSRGIYSIGRFVAIKDAGLTGKLPDTRIKHPRTGRALSEDWVDPSDETTIRYNTEIICELAAAGIDEINLDYIRFSTAEFGALGVYSGKEKADHVEAFIRAARETIDRCGPKTKLGLSTFAILGWNYPVNVETLGQDVVRFAPLVDIISPMAYPATFSQYAYYNPEKDPRSRMYWLVYRTITGYEELLGPEQSKKLRPWIQGYGVTTKNMTDQMDAVSDAGLCGFTVWNANNAYAPTYRAMKKHVRSEKCEE